MTSTPIRSRRSASATFPQRETAMTRRPSPSASTARCAIAVSEGPIFPPAPIIRRSPGEARSAPMTRSVGVLRRSSSSISSRGAVSSGAGRSEGLKGTAVRSGAGGWSAIPNVPGRDAARKSPSCRPVARRPSAGGANESLIFHDFVLSSRARSTRSTPLHRREHVTSLVILLVWIAPHLPRRRGRGAGESLRNGRFGEGAARPRHHHGARLRSIDHQHPAGDHGHRRGEAASHPRLRARRGVVLGSRGARPIAIREFRRPHRHPRFRCARGGGSIECGDLARDPRPARRLPRDRTRWPHRLRRDRPGGRRADRRGALECVGALGERGRRTGRRLHRPDLREQRCVG